MKSQGQNQKIFWKREKNKTIVWPWVEGESKDTQIGADPQFRQWLGDSRTVGGHTQALCESEGLCLMPGFSVFPRWKLTNFSVPQFPPLYEEEWANCTINLLSITILQAQCFWYQLSPRALEGVWLGCKWAAPWSGCAVSTFIWLVKVGLTLSISTLHLVTCTTILLVIKSLQNEMRRKWRGLRVLFLGQKMEALWGNWLPKWHLRIWGFSEEAYKPPFAFSL